MAVKKTDLYSTLWASCDELRGGMEPSQYKDYVLLLLFVRYVSDKAKFDKSISIPSGSSFNDFITFKGKSDIGEKMNTAVRALAKANTLEGVFDNTDFNDESKLGKGKDLVDTLTKLIGIFENPNLNFANNKADGDDILGDAYEYLMMKFSIESGKSKGQFYTPAEVSRIMAKVIGVENAQSNKETIYDPTCGSGSLLLKVMELAKSTKELNLPVYGQEFVTETAALARMNMWLHGVKTAEIKNGNTMASPEFLDKNGNLTTFNYIVSNPPFSDKKWRNNLGNPSEDIYQRFIYGTPPDKNGDYAFLQHLVASLKDTGTGAIILPHGVLFRGNAEEAIRTALVKAGIIKAIIGLPANLFYGTGIPACILVLDKKNKVPKRDIFMIDASKGFVKDGNKNRLREQDIHLICDAFDNLSNNEKFSRLVSYDEIEKNRFNLNLPRYIDSSIPADIQDIQAHISGGIPKFDIDNLENYWKAFPSLKSTLLRNSSREGYLEFIVDTSEINKVIHSNADVRTFKSAILNEFEIWKKRTTKLLEGVNKDTRPKVFVKGISENLLDCFKATNLLNKYAIYQSFMEYWDSTMKDDLYLIVENGWLESAKPRKLDTKSKELVDFQVKKDKFRSEILPASVLIKTFLVNEGEKLAQAESDLEVIGQEMVEFYENNSDDEDLLSEYFTKGKITKKELTATLKDKNLDKEVVKLLNSYKVLLNKEDTLKKVYKKCEQELTKKLIEKYMKLNDKTVESVVIENKWMESLAQAINDQLDSLIQSFTKRLIELEERYKDTLPQIEEKRDALSSIVKAHIEKMGVKWKL